MIHLLTTDQVADGWDVYGEAIREAVEEEVRTSPLLINNILASILKGKTQCWVMTEEKIPYAIWTTYVLVSEPDGLRTLFIHTFTSLRFMTNAMWNNFYSAMRKFAQRNGCSKIAALTNSNRVKDVVIGKLGGKAEYTLVTLEV